MPKELTLAEHAEAWWREQGKQVPINAREWDDMYQHWIDFAFSALGPNRCADCRAEFIPTKHTPGYATTQEGNRVCYDCCAIRDARDMRETGRAVLYLTKETNGNSARYVVTNWPGTLRYNVNSHTKGSHNIARTRTDVWFTGPDGQPWHGVQYGENTQLTHCRRIKS